MNRLYGFGAAADVVKREGEGDRERDSSSVVYVTVYAKKQVRVLVCMIACMCGVYEREGGRERNLCGLGAAAYMWAGIESQTGRNISQTGVDFCRQSPYTTVCVGGLLAISSQHSGLDVSGEVTRAAVRSLGLLGLLGSRVIRVIRVMKLHYYFHDV
jgi:hypothetical protein